ncbi:hypothetical protein [Micromonospora sp. NPDC000668]|uniref:hypothetical protein n=1 Tax=Micromonospora sp. NPDC000668 TaxID=3364219 RepID=UPI00369CEEB3
MGFVAGDPVAWTRWWLPADVQPTLDRDGMLPDLSDMFLRHHYPKVSVLADHSERRAVILLADAGMGKSFELRAEVGRLRSEGYFVEDIDLGEHLSSSEVSDAVRQAVSRWRASGAECLTLALDGFDEPLFSVVNLGDVLRRELGRLDRDNVRVVITCRSSLWPVSLAHALSEWSGGDAVSLALAPLTVEQIRQAAATEVDDVDAFVAAIRDSGAGPLAARPITLRLLLGVNRSSELPNGRVDVYHLGVEVLAQEVGERRHERRQAGPALDRLIAAAGRLAAATLLTGRPRVAYRRTSVPAVGQVELDILISKDVTRDDLEAVFDSALLTGGADGRTWIHRSVEEYLCAEHLRAVPHKTALALLADPSDPSDLLPQLAEVGAWLAAADVGWFEWMLTHEPQSLVNLDLSRRSDEQRRRVGQAILSHLGGGDVPDAGLKYHGMAYDGLDADLRPLLDPNQPAAIRREAVLIAAVTDLHELDRPIFDMLVAAVQNLGPDDYDDEVQVACFAAHALTGSPDQELVDSLKAMAANAGVPRQLRISLLESLWPTRLSTQELLAIVTGDDRRPNVPGIGRRMIRLFERATRTGKVRPRDLLPWFTDALSHHDPSYDNLAGRAVLDVVSSVGPGEPLWGQAVAITVRSMHASGGFFRWMLEDLAGIGDDHRRAFARDVLMGRRSERGTARLLDAGVIRTEDLDWWLTELAEGLAADTPAALSAKVVLDRLVWRMNEQESRSARQRALTLNVPPAVVENLFGDAAIRARKEQEALAAREAHRHDARGAEFMFSVERLDAALSADDFAAAISELDRQVEVRDRGWQPVNAWPALDAEKRQRVAAAAAKYLRRGDLDAADHETSSNIVQAHAILAIQDRHALDEVPPDHWLGWLPHLLRTPAADAASRFARARSVAADRERTDEILIEQLRRDVSEGRGWLVHQLGGYRSTALSEAALDLTTTADADPRSLAGLLELAATSLPELAADAAIAHLRRYRAVDRTLDDDAGQESDDNVREAQERAVEATAALARMPGLQDAFPEILAALQEDIRFARAVIAKVSAELPAFGQALTPNQLATLYLWARDALPPRRKAQPGVPYSVNPAEEFPEEVLARLTNIPDAAAVQALDEIARTTGDVWLRHTARLARTNAKAAAWQPPDPTEILTVLDNHVMRIVRTPDQLAKLILEELDTLIKDIQGDRAIKALFWHRQRRGGQWVGYAPPEENELSDRLARELERRVRPRIAMLRETEIQPRLAGEAGDQPDLLAIASANAGDAVKLPIEVKCNWHRDVITAIEAQLGNRYLRGPHGSTGIYIVGYYDGDAWISGDTRRNRARKGCSSIAEELDSRARMLADRGINARVRVLDLSLDENPSEGAGEAQTESSR